MVSSETSIGRNMLADQQARAIENTIAVDLRQAIYSVLSSNDRAHSGHFTDISIMVEHYAVLGFVGFRLTITITPQPHTPIWSQSLLESIKQSVCRNLPTATLCVYKITEAWGIVTLDFNLG